MDLARAINELWRRRLAVLAGLVVAACAAIATAYDVRLSPPGLESKAFAFGTASTSLLVDTPRTSVTDLAAELDPLVDRAVLLARLGTSATVQGAIARRIGAGSGEVSIDAPVDDAVRPQADRDARVQSILAEDRRMTVSFTAERGLPNILIVAQAPNEADALKLAGASAAALREYAGAQTASGQPAGRRLVLRQLGAPTSGTIGEGVNGAVAVLAFVATLSGWCLLVVFTAGLRRNLASVRAAEGQAAKDPASLSR